MGMAKRVNPKILIFDVDGVLIDVKESYWRSGLQTMRHITGKRATWAEFYEWKRQPGNNDDWLMVSRWATARGFPTSYEQARRAFQPFYWGKGGKGGNVLRERLLVTPKLIMKWARHRELNLFTGERGRNLPTASKSGRPGRVSAKSSRWMMAAKNHTPTASMRFFASRDPKSALYLGDNIDDALAAESAGVPFMAILPKTSADYRNRAKAFRELGALALLERARDLDRWLR